MEQTYTGKKFRLETFTEKKRVRSMALFVSKTFSRRGYTSVVLLPREK